MTRRTKPISVGTYVRSVLDVRRAYRADDRAVLIGHDWGADAGYGVVATEPTAFRRFVTLAVPPAAALAADVQLPATQAVVLHLAHPAGRAPEAGLLEPGFWESLWADWSPGYDPREDVAELRRHVTADNIADIIAPYRATFNPDFADPDATAEAAATLQSAAGTHAVPPRRRRRSARRRITRPRLTTCPQRDRSSKSSTG